MQWGQKPATAGIARLSDIVDSRLGRVRPERDKYVTISMPWTYYLTVDEGWW
jgi:hypothetical protein